MEPFRTHKTEEIYKKLQQKSIANTAFAFSLVREFKKRHSLSKEFSLKRGRTIHHKENVQAKISKKGDFPSALPSFTLMDYEDLRARDSSTKETLIWTFRLRIFIDSKAEAEW